LGGCLLLAKLHTFVAQMLKLFSFQSNFLTKFVGLHFGRFFHELIWSPWPLLLHECRHDLVASDPLGSKWVVRSNPARVKDVS
jgi:hypothetical protein